MSKGTCLRKFEDSGACINFVMFYKDDTQVISGSDRIKVWGLNSGKKINEFGILNNNSNITHIKNYESDLIITAASDGYIRIFNTRTGVQKFLITPKKSMPNVEKGSFYADVLDEERILLCSQERYLCISDFDGRIIKTFGLEDKT